MAGGVRVDLYWSFRSPCSDLALSRVAQFAAQYPVEWNLKLAPYGGADLDAMARELDPILEKIVRDTAVD